MANLSGINTLTAAKNAATLDSMIASAVLDRLLHHAEAVTIKDKSYRAKDRIEEAA